MRRPSLALSLIVATGTASLGGCHNGEFDSVTPPPVSPDGPQCLLTMTAPVNLGTAGATCTTTSAYATASNTTTITVTAGSGSLRESAIGGASLLVPFTFAFSLTRSGHVAEGTYSNTTSGVVGSVTITNAGSATYMASAGAGNNVGTFTLVITKSTVLTNTANGTAYLIDGTLDATVPAVASSGATGTVTAHQTFKNN